MTSAFQVWATAAPEAVAVRRLGERNGLSEADALARIRSQMTNEERLARAQAMSARMMHA